MIEGARPLSARVYAAGCRLESALLVLHFHAGAFVAGTLDSGSTIAGLVADAGAVVVSLDYPLAPAQPFPQAVEAGYAVLLWAYRQRRRLTGRNAPLLVAGEEAGGNLAAAVGLMARDRDGPALAGQILLSPMLDVCVATASLRDVQAGPVGCPWADGWHQYLPRAADAMHPYATPGTSMRLGRLPPALLLTAQDDPLRDETQAYAQRLREADVPVAEAVLAMTTGWPVTYMQPSSVQAPWAGVVREHVHQFLLERAAVAA